FVAVGWKRRTRLRDSEQHCWRGVQAIAKIRAFASRRNWNRSPDHYAGARSGDESAAQLWRDRFRCFSGWAGARGRTSRWRRAAFDRWSHGGKYSVRVVPTYVSERWGESPSGSAARTRPAVVRRARRRTFGQHGSD